MVDVHIWCVKISKQRAHVLANSLTDTMLFKPKIILPFSESWIHFEFRCHSITYTRRISHIRGGSILKFNCIIFRNFRTHAMNGQR